MKNTIKVVLEYTWEKFFDDEDDRERIWRKFILMPVNFTEEFKEGGN
jgi:hypothetical protein